MSVDIDTVRALRDMRIGVAVVFVLATGCLVANMAEYPIIGSTFIGAMVGYTLQRLLSLTSKIREFELGDPD